MGQVVADYGHSNKQIKSGSPHPAYKPFLYGAVISGLAVVISSIVELLQAGIGYQWLVLASLTILTSAYNIKIPAINSKISFGETLYFTNVLLFGTPAGVITAALDGLAGSIRSRTGTPRLKHVLFNMAVMAYSAHIAGTLFYHLVPKDLLWRASGMRINEMLLPLGVLAFSHYIFNSGSIAVIVSLEKNKNAFAIWKDSFLWTSITYFAGTAAAGFIAITMGAVTPKVLGVIVPVLLAVYFSYKTYLGKVDEARSLAYYDSVTGLPNRLQFKEQLEESVGWAERQNGIVAVMFLDVDHFKRVNDTYGHSIGDLLLRSVASRLAASIRGNTGDLRYPSDVRDSVIGRFGGDEFTILVRQISKPEDAAQVARRLLQSLSTPYALDGREVSVTASIGVSIYPYDGSNTEMLLKNADAAMYHAKENGRNGFHLYSRSMNEKLSEKLSLENDLRNALSRGELGIHYQPIVDARSMRISGAEALIRWRHPTRGLIPAAEFISLAEEVGLIRPIGDYVLRGVCAQIAAWLKDRMNVVPIAVNLSLLQLKQERLASMIAETMEEASLSREFLALELTESAIMGNEQTIEATLGELHALGVKVSIDDFGTGYSSLSRIKRFKLDALKIDQSFVSGCTKNPDDRATIAAIIAMAHSLGLRVTAEGIENQQQLDLLRNLGCDDLQGLYLHHPVPPGEFAGLLADKAALEWIPREEDHEPLPQQRTFVAILDGCDGISL